MPCPQATGKGAARKYLRASRRVIACPAMKLKTALRRAKSVTALARVLGVTRQAVQQYQKTGELPRKREQQLKDATDEDWARAVPVPDRQAATPHASA